MFPVIKRLNPNDIGTVSEQISKQNATIRYMGMKSMPLVFTSINPFGSLDWQLKCYNSFRSTGHEIFSVNHDSEIHELSNQLNSVSTIPLSDREVSTCRPGKSLGKIHSVLTRMLSFDKRDYYVLVNSDIYFSGRKSCISQLLSKSSAVALTRSDIQQSEEKSSFGGLPYRGGLDIFLFTRSGLVETIDHIEKYPAICEEMAIGIPGWDYMIGAIILSEIGGRIMDSGNLFQHAVHKQTYSQLDDFRNIASVLYTKGLVSSQEPSHAAADYAQRISYECQQNYSFTAAISLVFRRYSSSNMSHTLQFSPALQLSNELTTAISRLYFSQNLIKIRKTILHICKNEIKDYLAIKNCFLFGNSFTVNILQLIVCASCILSFNQGTRRLSSIYPTGNAHKACLNVIKRVEQPEERTFYLVDLYYTELIQYNIFNIDIFCYLVSIQHDRLYVSLLQQQFSLIKALIA